MPYASFARPQRRTPAPQVQNLPYRFGTGNATVQNLPDRGGGNPQMSLFGGRLGLPMMAANAMAGATMGGGFQQPAQAPPPTTADMWRSGEMTGALRQISERPSIYRDQSGNFGPQAGPLGGYTSGELSAMNRQRLTGTGPYDNQAALARFGRLQGSPPPVDYVGNARQLAENALNFGEAGYDPAGKTKAENAAAGYFGPGGRSRATFNPQTGAYGLVTNRQYRPEDSPALARQAEVAAFGRGTGPQPADMSPLEQRRIATIQGQQQAIQDRRAFRAETLGRAAEGRRAASRFGSFGGNAGTSGATSTTPGYTPGATPTGSSTARVSDFQNFVTTNEDFVGLLGVDPSTAPLSDMASAFGNLDSPNQQDEATYKSLLEKRAAADPQFRKELDAMLVHGEQITNSAGARAPIYSDTPLYEHANRIRRLFGKPPLPQRTFGGGYEAGGQSFGG